MEPNTYNNTTSTNTHNPLTGDGVTNTHNPLTGDKAGPHPPSGTNPATGRTGDDNFGRNEQQHIGHPDTTGARTGTHTTGADTGTHTGAGAGLFSGRDNQNTHNPLTGDGVTNTHNPITGDKTGPHPPADTNPVTGRTAEGDLGRHEQRPGSHTDTTGARTGTHTTGAHTGTHTGAGTGRDDNNTHNPLTGDGVTNTHNPMTGDKTGPHPPADTNPITGRTAGGDIGRHDQRPADHTGATGARTGAHTTGAHTGAHTAGGVGPTSDSNTHNTHNPLTGGGATNTHNPMTGDKTGPHPPADANPVTGRTGGDLGRHEQRPVDHAGTTGARTGAHTTGANTGAHTVAGAGLASGRDDHNTHNPLTGDGITNTRNPMTGDKTGPHPPADTNPVTGRTAGGDIGRHEQQPVDHAGTTGARTGAHTTGAHTGTHTVAGAGLSSGRDDHNTHNPLTSDGVTNTHNPMTGDKTGPHPSSGANPTTGRTNVGTLGQNEQQRGTTGTGTHDHNIHDTARGAHITGAGATTGTGQQPTSTKASGGGAKAALGRVEATIGAMINNSEMHAKGVQKQDEAKAAMLAKEQGTHDGADVRH